MKKIFNLFLILSLLVGSVSAVNVSAPMPYPVYGTVTIAGERAGSLEVQILNVKTGEVIGQTTEQGDFVMDFSEFKKGWNANDQYKITYCINDIRCNPVTDVFMLEGDAKDLSKDLPSTGIVCVEGNVLKENCPDGTEIVKSNCVSGKWVNTDNKCTEIVEPPLVVCTEGDTKEVTCDDGTNLISAICLNNEWKDYEVKCPEVITPPTQINWTWVLIIFGILAVIGVIIYFVSKR